MSGKILLQNLRPLIVGRNSFLGSHLTQSLINSKSNPLTVDLKDPPNLFTGETFTKMNVADNSLFEKYLSKSPKIDALINLAAIRKSYNYYMSYLISKSILEKFRDNEINEFGCRGVIINLIYLSSNYNAEYFQGQEDFSKQYGIDDEKIDEQVYDLADQLTANRIRCNTIMINEKVNQFQFCDLLKHIIQDQYISGQVINMEDNLRHEPPTYAEIVDEAPKFSHKKKHLSCEPYNQPPLLK